MCEKYIVYGNGNVGKKFIEQVGIHNVELILDKRVDKGNTERYKGITVLNPEDYLNHRHEEMPMIIAIYDWIPVAEYLESYGLSLEKNFLPSSQYNSRLIDFSVFCKVIDDDMQDVLSSMVRGRKIAMCYGLCHSIFYKNEISNQDSFNDNYVFVDLPLASSFNDKNYSRLYDKKIWSYCDLFICNKLENLNYKSDVSTNRIIELLPEKTKVISVTGAQFKGFFPQTIAWDLNKVSQEIVEEFSWGDKYLNKMCKKGMSTKEICSIVMNENFLEAKKIQKFFKDAIDNMFVYEKNFDIKIADYVNSNYKKEQLYYSPTHLTEDTMREISKRIVFFLGLEWDEELHGNVRTDTHEVPIYPSVLYALDMMESLTPNKTYNPGDYYTDKEKIDLQKYIERYCELYKLEMNN